MSNLELSAFAAAELGKNPFIEDDSAPTETKTKNQELKQSELDLFNKPVFGAVDDIHNTHNG